MTILHDAIKSENLKEFKRILANKEVDIDAQNDCGETPLFLAVRMTPLDKKFLSFIDELMKAKPNINIPNENGDTPLHIAVKLGLTRPGLDQYLMRKGADINAQSVIGETPFYTAVSWGSIDFARRLMRAGAEMNTESKLMERYALDILSDRTPEEQEFAGAMIARMLFNGILPKTKNQDLQQELQTIYKEQQATLAIISAREVPRLATTAPNSVTVVRKIPAELVIMQKEQNSSTISNGDILKGYQKELEIIKSEVQEKKLDPNKLIQSRPKVRFF